MNMVLTLIVNPQNGDVLKEAERRARDVLPALGAADILSEGEAIDLPAPDGAAALKKQFASAFSDLPVDWAIQQAEGRRKKLFLADMDSTMITVECIDELADFAGIKDHVAAITEAAMRGELDFEGALTERVALLKGLPLEKLALCYKERIKLMGGARTLVQTMKAKGVRTVLVSGGFTYFTEKVGAAIGFDRHRANILETEGYALSGTVARPICGAHTKLETLQAESAALGIAHTETLAVGDGANDIPMIDAAGLGVAYHAKPKTAAAADVAINHTDLTALLFLQGYRRSEFVA
ncbi:MAG: phosphoserine phosphatase SerB [Alphaproteobacteria bacterium]|nr:MAG: phosphoserine phosphatase SerB [Alphaproteobacteria bacterium]